MYSYSIVGKNHKVLQRCSFCSWKVTYLLPHLFLIYVKLIFPSLCPALQCWLSLSVQSCGFTCEQTLSSTESLALLTPGFVWGWLGKSCWFNAAKLVCVLPFQQFLCNSPEEQSRHTHHTNFSQPAAVRNKLQVSCSEQSHCFALGAPLCVTLLFHPQSSSVTGHWALAEPVAAGKNCQKAFVWKLLPFFFSFCYLKVVDSLSSVSWGSQPAWWVTGMVSCCSKLELVMREAEGEEGQSASTESTADLREAPGQEGKWAGRSVTVLAHWGVSWSTAEQELTSLQLPFYLSGCNKLV